MQGKICSLRKWVGRLALSVMCAASLRGERINQEGRILGPEVPVASPTLFNTPAADAIVAAMQIMPLDSPWNEDISERPLLSNSSAMVAQIRADLASNRRTLRAFHEMNYVLVPNDQPLVGISFLEYPDESDPSPYPIPENMPVETWPRGTGNLTLAQWQQDVNNTGGDRHSIVVMPGTRTIWETWQARLVGAQWRASNGARFSLATNALRPTGWTSGDAAGLPMFPALVRYDECVRGMVEHAMRIVVARSRREFIYPATHQAGSVAASNVNVPAMGQRVRLRATFPITSSYTMYEQAVLRGLKKYGAFVADNGNFFSISVTPDERYPSNAFTNLASIDVENFEIVQSTGANEGPRSAGAPSVDAGGDITATLSAPTPLGGNATGTNLSVQWTKYSGPGVVQFQTPSQSNTTATFSLPGVYTLMLSARDQVHAPAFDAMVVTVQDSGLPPATNSAVKLSNLSTRSFAGVNSAAQIAGFTITGAAKRVIVRAGGPSLGSFGVPNALIDPVLTLYSGATVLSQNDNWGSALAADFAAVGAPVWPVGSRDAAVSLTLPPGAYTAHVTGVNTSSGVALVEIFDADGAASDGRLANLSTRSTVGVGGEILIGGLVVSGSGAKRVVLRAAGPALAMFGVAGVLADPVLTVYSGAMIVAQNDDWEPEAALEFSRVGAGSWSIGSKDAAVILTLQPGAYTAHVAGRNGTTGITLFEVFEYP